MVGSEGSGGVVECCEGSGWSGECCGGGVVWYRDMDILCIERILRRVKRVLLWNREK